MTKVDDKVVSVSLDTSKFMRGKAALEKAIYSLESKLNFKNSGAGLDKMNQKAADASSSLSGMGTAGANAGQQINAAAEKVNLDSISESSSRVQASFSAMQVAFITAVASMTQKAIAAGTQIVNALFVKPKMDGLNEYELKINSIQTLLSNNAGTQEVIEAELDNLNDYADKTIYNFAQMTDAVAKFSNAGIDIKTATTSIKGFANVAAGAGANATSTAMAMQQLSQAMAAGTVRLEDWMSLETANIASKKFQNELLDTAAAMGIAVDQSESFRYSLQSGWLTAEVMTKTLERMSTDASLLAAATEIKTFTQLWGVMQEVQSSAWATSWGYIIGDITQAKELMGQLAGAFDLIVGPSNDARNAMLKFWNENGGRAALIEGITNVFQQFWKVVEKVKDAWREFMPKSDVETLNDISIAIGKVLSSFKISEKVLKAVGNAVGAVSRAVSMLVSLLKALWELLKPILVIAIKMVGALAIAVGSALAAVANFVIKTIDALGLVDGVIFLIEFMTKYITLFSQSITKYLVNAANKLKPVFEGLGSVFKSITGGIVDFVSATFDLFKILPVFGETGNAMSKAEETTSKTVNYAKKGASILTDIVRGIKDVLQWFADGISNIFSWINENVTLSGIYQAMNMIITVFSAKSVLGILDSAKNFMNGLAEIVEAAGGILESAANSIDAFTQSIKIGNLKTIAISLVLLAGALWVISTIDSKTLLPSLGAIAAMFFLLTTTMIVLDRAMKKIDPRTLGTIGFAMMAMGGAILTISTALKILSTIPMPELVKATITLSIIIVSLLAIFKTLDEMKNSVLKGGIAMYLMAHAINLLAIGLIIMKLVDWESIGKAGAIIGGLALVFVLISRFEKKIVVGAAMMLAMASSVNILIPALLALNFVKWESIGKAGAIIGGLAAVFITISVLSKFAPSMTKAAIAFILFAHAIQTVAIGLAALALIPTAALWIGIAAMAVLLGLLTLFGALASGPIGVGLIILTSAFLAFSVGVMLLAAGVMLFATAMVALAAVSTSLPLIATNVALAITMFISTLLQGVAKWAPLIIEAIFAVLTAIVEAIPDFVRLLFDSLISLLNSLAEQIRTRTGEVMEAGINIFTAIFEGIWNAAKSLVGLVKEWGPKILQWLKDALIAAGNKIISVGKDIINWLWKGIKSLWSKVTGFASDLWEGIKSGFDKLWGKIKSFGASIMDSLFGGMEEGAEVNSPSKRMIRLMGHIGDGMSVGTPKEVSKAKKAGTDIMSAFNNAVDESVRAIDTNVNPTITPVLDLSNVKRDSRSINDMINTASAAAGFSVETTRIAANGAAKAVEETNQNGNEIDNSTDAKQINYNFNQTNNSPKALSPTEIYRQSRNLFAQLKKKGEPVV